MIRAEIANGKKAVKDTQIALTAMPPRKPVWHDLPYPNRNNFANDNDFNNAVRDWQARNDQHRRDYDAAVVQYDKDLAAFKKNQEDLKAKLPVLQAGARTQMAGFNEQVKTATEAANAADQKVAVQDTRIKGLADALRAAPETVRFKHGIVEWEDTFWALANLEGLLANLQAEIERVRDKLAAEAKATGRELPLTWEHPQQKRADALKALLKRVKDIRAAM